MAAEHKAQQLQGEIVTIETQVNDAKSGSSLQDLITRREDARAELQDLRDEALFAEAGRFHVNAVEKEYEQNQKPRVFERAAGHFSSFTHHSYELRLSRDTTSPRLFAVDLRSGEGRDLNELSEGTRAQLLLAARMAFAEEAQGGLCPLTRHFILLFSELQVLRIHQPHVPISDHAIFRDVPDHFGAVSQADGNPSFLPGFSARSTIP